MTSWLGRSEYQVRLLPPHLSQRHPPLLCLVLCDINCFYSFHNDVEHTTLVFASQPFVVPLSCHENTADAGLEDEGQAWSLLSMDGLLARDHSSNLLPFSFLPDPCALQSVAQVNLLPSCHARAGELE